MNFRANPQKLHEHSTNLPQPNNNTSSTSSTNTGSGSYSSCFSLTSNSSKLPPFSLTIPKPFFKPSLISNGNRPPCTVPLSSIPSPLTMSRHGTTLTCQTHSALSHSSNSNSQSSAPAPSPAPLTWVPVATKAS